MKLYKIFLFILCSLLLACPSDAPIKPISNFAIQPTVHWQNYDASTTIQSALTNKIIVITLSSKYCYYCQLMQLRTFDDAKVIDELNTYFIPIHLEGEAAEEIIDKLGLKSEYPQTVFISPTGQNLGSWVGYYYPDNYLQALKQVASSYYGKE